MNTQTPVETSNSRSILSLSLMCLLGIMTRSDGLAAVNHSPQWNGTTSLTYNLIDLDEFDPKAYYYCKWGNYLDYNEFGIVDMLFNHLTLGPYDNSNSDLFVTQYPGPLNRVFFPANTAWTAPNGSSVKGSVTFSLPNNQVELYRYLHFRNDLADAVTGNPIDASTKKLIVVFHGWNPSSNANSFTGHFETLLNNLAYYLSETDWRLVAYHWEADADTGPAVDLNAAVHGTRAAETAHQHGQHLAELLLAVTPDLEKVHLIAHSAGSWAARTTMRNLLAAHPSVKAELTLLDPFMPNAIVGVNSSLGEPIMSQADVLASNDQLYLLENYYAVELLTPGTQEVFNWRPTDLNLQVDWVNNVSTPYSGHDGPIGWYADTMYAAVPGVQPPASLSPFQLTQVGWQRSMFFQEPIIIRDLAGTNINSGASLTLSVDVTNWFQVKNPQAPSNFQYQWRRDGQAVLGATGPDLLFSPVRVSDSGSYSLTVSNAAGVVTSSTATLTVTPDPADLPRLSLSRPNGGPASVQFNVVPTETYRLQATANLTNWTTILTTNAVSSPVIFTDPESLDLNQRAYRVLWP